MAVLCWVMGSNSGDEFPQAADKADAAALGDGDGVGDQHKGIRGVGGRPMFAIGRRFVLFFGGGRGFALGWAILRP